MKFPEYYGDRPRYLWIQQGASIFESGWMAKQRFMHLNDLSHARFKRRGIAMISMLEPAEDRSGESDCAATAGWLHSEKIRETFDTATHRRWNRSHSERLFSCLADEQSVRYCPLCLKSCFHTLLFQFPVVLNCPHHGAPLVNRCKHCGKPIATLASEPGRDQALFCCAACGTPFVPSSQLTYNVLFGVPDAQTDFDEAHRIVAGMCSVDVINISNTMSLRDGTGDDFVRLYAHALFAVAHPGGIKPPWLLGLPSEVNRCPVVPNKSPAPVVEEDDRAQKTTLHQRLHELAQVVRSIDRELSRRVRAVCRHVHQSPLRFQSESIPFSGQEFSLVMGAHDCPCCAVLTWWRAHFRTYFGFELHFADAANSPLLADHGFWLGDLLPLEPDVLARDARTLFAGLAAQMWEWLSPEKKRPDVARVMYEAVSARKELLRAGYRLRGRIEQHKCGSDALDLPLLRHHFVVPELQCSRGQERYRVSYSLGQGIEYLKCCHHLRQQGALWKCDYYWRDDPASSKRRDRWYMDLAKECSLRLWNELYLNQLDMLQLTKTAVRRAAAFQ